MSPLYELQCDVCGEKRDMVLALRERNNPVQHDGCAGCFVRNGLDAPTIGAPAYQMQAVLSNGAHVKGHFGKEASRRRNVAK